MKKKLVVALWARDTFLRQGSDTSRRIKNLEAALETAAFQIRSHTVGEDSPRGLFAAPEYFFAHVSQCGRAFQIGNDRHIEEGEKDTIVLELKRLSRIYRGVIIMPGTIAWRKPFLRVGAKRYHSNGLHQGQLKTEERFEKALTRLDNARVIQKANRSTALASDFTADFHGPENNQSPDGCRGQ